MTVEPREGSPTDLVRRMERIEALYDDLVRTVSRVESNLTHADEINKLRFDGLDRAISLYGSKLDAFMTRMEGIMTGEVQTAASRDLAAAKLQAEREGAKVMTEWGAWRKVVDEDLEAFDTFRVQAQTITRLALLLAGTGWLALLVTVTKAAGLW